MHQILSKPGSPRLSRFEIPNYPRTEFRSFDSKNDSDRKTLISENQIGIGNRLIFGIIEIGPLSSENNSLQISDMNEISLLVVWV